MKKIIAEARRRALLTKDSVKSFFIRHRELSGITVIELVLILVIVIALLLIFKTQLINLINTIFDKITSESSGI